MQAVVEGWLLQVPAVASPLLALQQQSQDPPPLPSTLVGELY
jgi:hypothetical protein